MKKNTITFILASLFLFSGCDLLDRAREEADTISKRAHELIDQYRDSNDSRAERPFSPHFQSEAGMVPIINPQCSNNNAPKYIYFGTQADATQNIFTAIKNLYSSPYTGPLKPFWDVRYTNPISTYKQNSNADFYPNHSKLTGLDTRSGTQNITVGSAASRTDVSGTVIQSKCVNNTLAAGTTLNLNDAPVQNIVYGGIASTFIYQFTTNSGIKPWKANKSGNLMMQAYFDKPIYRNFGSNIGGSVSFALYMHNKKLNKNLSYIITTYAYGVAWIEEKAGIRFDPTTNIIHVATVVKDNSWWCFKSPKSKPIAVVDDTPKKTTKDDGKWPDFYRVNIHYDNLKAVLEELKKNPPAGVVGQNFGLNPEDWELTFIAVQYELAEEGGKASISGSFSGFGAYTSNNPIK